MSNLPISGFASGAPAQSGDEFVIARSGANFKLASSDIKTLIIGAGSVSIASGKTFTSSNTLTLAGTDSTTMTFPTTSATLARTDAGNTFTGNQVITEAVGGSGLSITGATQTTSQPVLNLTQTWNAGAVDFNGISLNIQNTASGSGSNLLRLQTNTGGAATTRFSVFSNGGVQGNGYIVGGSLSSYTVDVGYNTTAITLANNFSLAWYSQSNLATGGSRDLFLTRAAAATLQLGAADAAAPVAQTFKVQGVVAGTSNTAGANFTIQGSRGTGTGAGGSIIFQTAPAGSSGTAQNAYSTALTISASSITASTGFVITGQAGTGAFAVNTRGYIGFAADGVMSVRDWSLNDFNRLTFGGTTSSFPALKRSSASLICRLADDSANAAFESASVKTDAPSGGTSGTWKLGVRVAATTTLDTTQYIEVDVGGTLYKLAVVTS